MTKPNDNSGKKRSSRLKPIHHASDFDLDVLSGDDDLFRWFFLSFLFGVGPKTAEIFMRENEEHFARRVE